MSDERDLKQLSAQIEDLAQRIEFIADPAVKANVVALLQSLMELHAKGLSRVMELLALEGDSGRGIVESLAADELFGGLLLLYGLHPDGLQARVESGVQKAREHLRSSGAGLELLGVENGVVRVRLTAGGGGGCGSAGANDTVIRDFIYAAAPDVREIEIETIKIPTGASDTLVQLQITAAARPA
jgi:NifU-like domain